MTEIILLEDKPAQTRERDQLLYWTTKVVGKYLSLSVSYMFASYNADV